MADTITVRIDDRELTNALNRINKVLDNPSAIFSDIQSVMLEDVFDHFDKETGPKQRWKRSQRAIKQGGQTLQDKGILRESIIGRKNALRKTATVETAIVYAGVHNAGGKTGRNKSIDMPKREFMWLSPRAIKDIITVIEEGLVRAWGK